MTTDLKIAYETYWQRKRRLDASPPRFGLRRWWPDEGLSDVERLIFDAIGRADGVLDVGAGDLRVLKKFQAAGYRGDYHTQDVGGEYAHTYADLADVRRSYGAVLCLDVIEHLPLADGLALMNRLVEIVAPGGVLVIQTPNALCSRPPLGWDMTHLHCYNVGDLWAYLTCLGLATDGYRVVFGRPPRRPDRWLIAAFRAWLTTRILACDYAENILLIARKPADAVRRNDPNSAPLDLP